MRLATEGITTFPLSYYQCRVKRKNVDDDRNDSNAPGAVRVFGVKQSLQTAEKRFAEREVLMWTMFIMCFVCFV